MYAFGRKDELVRGTGCAETSSEDIGRLLVSLLEWIVI